MSRRSHSVEHDVSGRYNPIVIADRADEAASIVEVFPADIVVPAFLSVTNEEESRARVLDIYNHQVPQDVVSVTSVM